MENERRYTSINDTEGNKIMWGDTLIFEKGAGVVIEDPKHPRRKDPVPFVKLSDDKPLVTLASLMKKDVWMVVES